MDVDTPRGGVHTALGLQRGVNFGLFTSLESCKTVQLSHISALFGALDVSLPLVLGILGRRNLFSHAFLQVGG